MIDRCLLWYEDPGCAGSAHWLHVVSPQVNLLSSQSFSAVAFSFFVKKFRFSEETLRVMVAFVGIDSLVGVMFQLVSIFM